MVGEAETPSCEERKNFGRSTCEAMSSLSLSGRNDSCWNRPSDDTEHMAEGSNNLNIINQGKTPVRSSHW